MIRLPTGEGYIILIKSIVDDSCLKADPQPIVNIVAEFNIESEPRIKSKVFCGFILIGIGLHVGAVENTSSRKLTLDGAADGGIHEEVIVRA